MGKTWVKLYVSDMLDDPAMAKLSWEHRGMLAVMLALAGKLDIRDGDGAETGQLDTPDNVAWYLRCDPGALAGAIAELQKRGLIHERGGILFVSGYAARQARPPSAGRDAVAERVREHRAAQCNEDVTSPQRVSLPSEAESDAESDSQADEEPASTSDAAADAAPPDGEGCDACLADAVAWMGQFGVDGGTARKLTEMRGARRAMFWCAHAAARSDHLRNPAGLIVDRLKRGMDPPMPGADDGVWNMVCEDECAGHPAVQRPVREGYSSMSDEWRAKLDAAEAEMTAQGPLPG